MTPSICLDVCSLPEETKESVLVFFPFFSPMSCKGFSSPPFFFFFFFFPSSTALKSGKAEEKLPWGYFGHQSSKLMLEKAKHLLKVFSEAFSSSVLPGAELQPHYARASGGWQGDENCSKVLVGLGKA